MIDIQVDVRDAQAAAKVFSLGGFTRDDLTETAEAVKVGTQAIQAEWLKYISGVDVKFSGGDFQISRVSGAYATAVSQGLRYPMDGNPLKGGVDVNLEYADKLEQGFGEFDIKEGLLASPKARMTKGDNPHLYINVPFRHNEEDLPGDVLSKAKAGQRVLDTVRKTKSTSKGDYTWQTGQFTDIKRQPAGPQGAGQYMTFRRVSATSDPASWIHPGASPRPVSKAIDENLSDSLNALVSAAFERDIMRLSLQEGL